MVICLERGAHLMPLPLTVSCFSKIQIGFTFLVPAHPGSPGKRAVKRVCVCVCVCVYVCVCNNIVARSGHLPAFQTHIPRGCLVHLANTLLTDEESARDHHVLACKFARYSPILIFFTHRLSNKPFLIRLLTTPPHLKYAATLPCNLSLTACFFADINVSQGSVATCANCGETFNIHLTANLPRNLPVKIF